jgi:hypothetical protein
MPMKLKCPACGSDMRSRALFTGIHLNSYRVCPDCQSKYTVDPATKRRGLVIALFACATLCFSVPGFTRGFPWSLATLVSAIALLFYLGYTLSNMNYVEYRE